MSKASFHLILVKPTHYDDEGYPIQWRKSQMPSNTLACLNGLGEDARRRQVLGPDVVMHQHAYDETSERVRPDRIARDIAKLGGRALVAFVGVQSNQFPRAVDQARAFIKAGLPVCIGGFHVSGCVSMLPKLPADLQEAQDLGISLFAGEAEDGRLDRVLIDAYEGKLAPLYNHVAQLPVLKGQPVPILPAELVQRVDGAFSCMDLGRGCPYLCSFCTIINVQGRKSRTRSPDDLERTVRESYALGVRRFFITDDNFSRNSDWEALFDRIIHLREAHGMAVGLTIQVDTQCHRIPGFVAKAAQAGVEHVFIGLENINPDNLKSAKKGQNKIADYRVMLQQWRAHNVLTLAGYILGFPGDTKESILRDIEIIKRELPLDILELFMLTPLPGSEDHKVMLGNGEWMDQDLNKYDLNHRVVHHPRMTDSEWEEAQRAAWSAFYTPEHIKTILRRAAVHPAGRLGTLTWMLISFATAMKLEGVHPLESGLSRKKYREDRRPSLRRENPLVFYPRLAAELLWKTWSYWRVIKKLRKMAQQVADAPDRLSYSDLAIAPPTTDEFETLALYRETSGAENAMRNHRRTAAPVIVP